MTISHHPTDETLAAFAAGGLDEARALVVATHLGAVPALPPDAARLRGCSAARCSTAPNPRPMAERRAGRMRWRSSTAEPASARCRPMPAPARRECRRRSAATRSAVGGVSAAESSGVRSTSRRATGSASSCCAPSPAPPAASPPQGRRVDLRLPGRLPPRARPVRPGRLRRSGRKRRAPSGGRGRSAVHLPGDAGRRHRLPGWLGRMIQPFVRI